VSPLVGRETELDALARAVTKSRLVSLTGAPGVGKTALASTFAASRAAVWCSLTGVEGADAVCRELARALGLPESASSSAKDVAGRVRRVLAGRGKVVVVLDDADLARGALAKLLPGFMGDAPGARFVVSARARIALANAQRFEVGPLEVPLRRHETPDDVGRSSAVRLFLRAAASARPGYRLTPASAPHVAEIVRTLGGMPLAIELCAPRVVVLGEREIAALLAERLDALDAGAKGGRTLRGAFALSWDQLDAGDASVLAAAAVFRGSFDLSAAAAVAGASRLETAEALERLEESSLVRAFEPPEVPGTRRYVLHPSVRVFAAERQRRDARAETARRHAEHFASAAAPAGTAPRVDVLALDRDDLEAALTWAISERRAEVAARVALALAPLALARGPLRSFLDRVDTLLDRGKAPGAVAAELHLVRALARIHHGRRDDALDDLRVARRKAARARSLRVEVLAESKLGLVLGLKGSFSRAKVHFASARERLGRAGDPWLRGVVSKDLANVLSEEGDNATAMIELARARDLLHSAGDVREEGFVLMMLGSRLLDEGKLVDARRDCTRGLEALRAAGDHRSAAWCEVLLALTDAEEGDLLAARTRLDAALASFRTIGDAHTEGLVLGYLGNVALEQGALADAEDHYSDARTKLAEVGDAGAEGMFTGAAGVVDAALGREAAARERFARARALLDTDGRAARRDALEIMETVLEPVRRRRAYACAEEVRFARRVVAQTAGLAGLGGSRRADAKSPNELVVAADGSWLRTARGDVVKLGAGGAQRGVVRRLAEERVRYPGRAISRGDLVRAGWPGESILPAAAKNRLHVTIARLRRAGLDGLLLHDADGYMLDPAAPVRVAETGERPDGRDAARRAGTPT
jgi:predicted ATPase